MQSQRIRIRLKAFDYNRIDQSDHEILDEAHRTGAEVLGPVPLPIGTQRLEILRSPHSKHTCPSHYTSPPRHRFSHHAVSHVTSV